MPTVMNPHHFSHGGKVSRTSPQKVCISLGVALIIIGFVGVFMPGFLALHLSMAHNLVNMISGAFALWCGYSNSSRSVTFCLIFGALWGFLGIVGFILGAPGYPGVGNMEADQNLFRLIPNFLEFGTMDHIAHLLVSTFLLLTAYTFRKDRSYVRSFNVKKKL